MMKFRSLISLIGASVLLSGCLVAAKKEGFYVPSGIEKEPPNLWSCLDNQITAAKKAKWDDPIVVTETVKDNVYQSGLMEFKVGKPHVIKFTNLDTETRVLRAPIFFSRSSVLKIIHEGEEVTAPCLQAVAVAPQKTSEIYLVPLEAGYFDYHETFMSPPVLTELSTNGSVGLAYVY